MGAAVHHVPQTISATEQFPIWGQRPSQGEPASVDSRLHGSDLDTHDRRDLGVLVSLNVEEKDAVALLERQFLQGQGQGR